MKIRNIVGIMSGMIISTVLLSSIEGHSAGTNPITMTALQSTGSYVFDGNSSNDIKLYKSDLRNLYNEIPVGIIICYGICDWGIAIETWLGIENENDYDFCYDHFRAAANVIGIIVLISILLGWAKSLGIIANN